MDEVEYLGARGSLLGYNLYSYCENNPVMRIDPSGNWTLSFNINLNLNIIFGFSVSIGVAIDSKGESANQWSYSHPFDSTTPNIGLFDGGISVSAQYTNLNSVDNLESVASYYGASVGTGPYISGDLVSNAPVSDPSGEIIGGQLGVGIGYGIDAHVTQTKTKTINKDWKGFIGKFFELLP